MTLRQIFAIAGLGILALGATAGPGFAATARASDPISIFEGPHTDAHVLGRLEAGEEVTIDRCTTTGNWCRVFHDGPTGWVPASYLIGAAAKADATPGRSLTDPPFDR
jgi:uncharacterized protein YraI